MSNVLEDLLSQLDPATVGQIAGQLGVDEGTAQQGIQAALPLLLGGLARNTQTDDGAQALSSALSEGHNGSILSDVLGAVSLSTAWLVFSLILVREIAKRRSGSGPAAA